MNFKERIDARLKIKEEARNKLFSAIIDEESAEQRKANKIALDNLDAEIAELKEMRAACDAPVDDPADGFNVVDTMVNKRDAAPKGTDSIEYRKAFKNFIGTGERSKELREAAGNITTSDGVMTAIPENLVDRIIEKVENLGTIYSLVTKTAFPVGQTIPKEATKPVATWVGRNTSSLATSTNGEGLGSTVQKGVTLTTAITFASFKLRCEVAMTVEVDKMTLSAFENLFVKNVSAAMLRAKEFAIVDGDGYGMPTGILNSAAPEGQALEIAADEVITYATLVDAEAAIPAEKEANAKWCMSKKSFMAFMGMTDEVGQPIARVNFGLGGKAERTLLGREVVIYAPQSGSHLGNYAADVEADTMFAFIFDFEDYTLNSNYNLGISTKEDWDNEDRRMKAVEACDGKVTDNSSLVTITKKAAS